MGFTVTLSCELVADGNGSRRGFDDAQVTTVTGRAAVWTGGTETKPARQTVCTAPARYGSLTPTLTSSLIKTGRTKENERVTPIFQYFHPLRDRRCLCVPGCTLCCQRLFQLCGTDRGDTHQLKLDQSPPAWRSHFYTAHSSFLRRGMDTRCKKEQWIRTRKKKTHVGPSCIF